MAKNLLFVIDSLTIGGAEKSLVALLNLIDSCGYKIDLLLFRSGEELEKYLPEHVKILPTPEYFRFVNHQGFSSNKNIKYFCYRIITSVKLRWNEVKKRPIHSEQVIFSSIHHILPEMDKQYDVGIAYSQGMPTYFVANKVNAKKKLAWINTDYEKTLYDKDLDYKSYKKIDKIIAVSQNTRDAILKARKEYLDKVEIILDIVNPNVIYKMADEHPVAEFDNNSVNILTVGRLAAVKSYDTAIEVARLLKISGYKFKWFSIGEGSERKSLQKLIGKYELNDYFILLGKKLNPYPYMKNCDLYVQTSTKEGFGLTVIEAKILKKPIVCTDFPTAKELISNQMDGLVVKHDKDSIYNAIKMYLDDANFRNKIIQCLNTAEPYDSVDQLNKFYGLIEI